MQHSAEAANVKPVRLFFIETFDGVIKTQITEGMEWRKGCCTNPYSCRQNYILCIYAHSLYVFPGIGFLDFLGVLDE